MAAASLVLGILSILIALFGFGSLWWLAPVLGIIGIVLGVQGKKDYGKRGLAQAGFVCSIVGTVLSLLWYVACAALFGSLLAWAF